MPAIADPAEQSATPEALAKEALENEESLAQVMQGATSKEDATRSKSFKALLLLSEEHPELLYPKWDHFVDLLRSDNNYHKYQAIYILANLTRVDTQNRFESLFDTYYDLLDGKSVMTAAHLAGNSGKIARAKPQLESRITDKLLSIDETGHKPQRKDLIKGYAIEAFSEYFELSENKPKIVEFVEKQLESESPRTAKLAKEFLKRWQS